MKYSRFNWNKYREEINVHELPFIKKKEELLKRERLMMRKARDEYKHQQEMQQEIKEATQRQVDKIAPYLRAQGAGRQASDLAKALLPAAKFQVRDEGHHIIGLAADETQLEDLLQNLQVGDPQKIMRKIERGFETKDYPPSRVTGLRQRPHLRIGSSKSNYTNPISRRGEDIFVLPVLHKKLPGLDRTQENIALVDMMNKHLSTPATRVAQLANLTSPQSGQRVKKVPQPPQSQQQPPQSQQPPQISLIKNVPANFGYYDTSKQLIDSNDTRNRIGLGKVPQEYLTDKGEPDLEKLNQSFKNLDDFKRFLSQRKKP